MAADIKGKREEIRGGLVYFLLQYPTPLFLSIAIPPLTKQILFLEWVVSIY